MPPGGRPAHRWCRAPGARTDLPTRRPEDITLAQIVSSVDGPIVSGDFGQPHANGACDHEGQCVLLALWAELGETMRRHLQSFTLADMVTRARGGVADATDLTDATAATSATARPATAKAATVKPAVAAAATPRSNGRSVAARAVPSPGR